MTDRELMQQALEALELLAWYENPATKVQVRKPRNGGPIVTMYPHKVATEAAAPLRERLAQPEKVMAEYKFQTYASYKTDGEMKIGVVPETRPATREEKIVNPGVYEVRSCAECGKSGGWALYCVECMEKLAQPEQAPVAWMDEFGNVFPLGAQRGPKHLNEPMKPLYTAPPQRKPLTDAVLAEREACAAMLDANAMACENPIYRSLLQANAQAIREMGQP